MYDLFSRFFCIAFQFKKPKKLFSYFFPFLSLYLFFSFFFSPFLLFLMFLLSFFSYPSFSLFLLFLSFSSFLFLFLLLFLFSTRANHLHFDLRQLTKLCLESSPKNSFRSQHPLGKISDLWKLAKFYEQLKTCTMQNVSFQVSDITLHIAGIFK